MNLKKRGRIYDSVIEIGLLPGADRDEYHIVAEIGTF
jgi:hypothetical protein